MDTLKKVHIFGASGSETSTIASIVCKQLNYDFIDTDDYFWKTPLVYTDIRPEEERKVLLNNKLASSNQWVLSGSLCGWGDCLISYFDLVVFVQVPNEIRMERLLKREYKRYGSEILQGGSQFEESKKFLNWAATYESSISHGRTLEKHENWLKNINCPILRITNIDLYDSVEKILQRMRE